MPISSARVLARDRTADEALLESRRPRLAGSVQAVLNCLVRRRCGYGSRGDSRRLGKNWLPAPGSPRPPPRLDMPTRRTSRASSGAGSVFRPRVILRHSACASLNSRRFAQASPVPPGPGSRERRPFMTQDILPPFVRFTPVAGYHWLTPYMTGWSPHWRARRRGRTLSSLRLRDGCRRDRRFGVRDGLDAHPALRGSCP